MPKTSQSHLYTLYTSPPPHPLQTNRNPSLWGFLFRKQNHSISAGRVSSSALGAASLATVGNSFGVLCSWWWPLFAWLAGEASGTDWYHPPPAGFCGPSLSSWVSISSRRWRRARRFRAKNIHPAIPSTSTTAPAPTPMPALAPALRLADVETCVVEGLCDEAVDVVLPDAAELVAAEVDAA